MSALSLAVDVQSLQCVHTVTQLRECALERGVLIQYSKTSERALHLLIFQRPSENLVNNPRGPMRNVSCCGILLQFIARCGH